MQKLNCILKILFNIHDLTHWAEKIKILHAIETKWGIRNCCQDKMLKRCSHIEKVRGCSWFFSSNISKIRTENSVCEKSTISFLKFKVNRI